MKLIWLQKGCMMHIDLFAIGDVELFEKFDVAMFMLLGRLRFKT